MSQSPLRAALLAALMSFACVTALAQPPADSTLASGETQAAAAAVTRDDPLPGWALPFAEMPATQRQDPVVLRVAETQIHLGEQVAYLVNRAIQVNDP
ncbi:MAG TPA: hypothetical protein VFP68_12715, partial [Burkholderiaceae bacterium]|nr:hypothetical protein [Burkholderiaceae bacterium]